MHLHLILSFLSATGAMENVRLAAISYQQDFPGHNYFQDWVEVHSILGLTVEYGTAVAVASLVGRTAGLSGSKIESNVDLLDRHTYVYLGRKL